MAEKTNVVFWANQGQDDIIYRSAQDDLRTITSVTVPEHAVALFIRDGQLMGVLDPGRHVITSANIPWLTKLYNLALGFKETPFKVWIVFVSLKMFNGKWGIRSMIKAAKEYEVPIVLMANGDFQFRINDTAVFYTQVLGGLNAYSTGDVNSFMKSFINEQIIQQMNSQYYMDIMENLEKASTNTKILIEQYFAQRGIELLSLKINEVLTTDEDRQKVFNYLQFSSKNGEAFRRYEVMESMANAIGDSTGGAAMGAGMLLFPQMYQQLQQQPVQGVQQLQQQPVQGVQQQQQQPTKVMCPTCGGLNEYPYKYCNSCGQPSPMAAQGQPAQAQRAPQTGNAGASAGGKKFNNCPYCGEDISSLPKTPKFCPYCSEQIN